MNTIITNRYFLIITAIFLVVTIGTMWFFMPPLIRQYNDNKTANSQLTTQISAEQAEAAGVTKLIDSKVVLTSLYDQATLALPNLPSAELLLLQLDGLTKSLGLSATITVPLTEGSLASQVAPPVADTNSNDVKPGSGSTGGSQPVVTTTKASTNTEFTISGDFDFPTTLKLLTKMKTFARWNTITNISITKNATATTAKVTGQAFWIPASNLLFSGSAQDLLQQARTLFNRYQSYTTTPDAATEGQYGKSNPFE